jgi:hypothetical protein
MISELLGKQATFAYNVSYLLQFIHDKGYMCTFGDAFRSPEQAKLNAAAGKGIANSLHCERLAIDLNLFDKDGKYLTSKEDFQKIGEYWKDLNPKNRWGGDFQHLIDSNHFEMQNI